ncbi:hypothetical protein ABZP36_028783 [Zizania latifolia]
MARNPGCSVFIGEISTSSRLRSEARIARRRRRGGSLVHAGLAPNSLWLLVAWLGVGNLDEKVPERVLYEILIQVGRVVDLHIPRDKETSRPKGYAFAEYETEEIAQYAVRLFSGLVRLHNRTLRFAISGQDKPSSNGNIPVTPKLNPIMAPKPPQLMRSSDTPASQRAVVNGRIAGIGASPNHSYDVHSEVSNFDRKLVSAYGAAPNPRISVASQTFTAMMVCDFVHMDAFVYVCVFSVSRFAWLLMSTGWIQVLTEQQPQSEKKAPRARPMSAKAVVVLCATSFVVGHRRRGVFPAMAPGSPSSLTTGSAGV